MVLQRPRRAIPHGEGLQGYEGNCLRCPPGRPSGDAVHALLGLRETKLTTKVTTMTLKPVIQMHSGTGPQEWWHGSSLEGDCHAQIYGPWRDETRWRVWTQGRAGGTSNAYHSTRESAQGHIATFFGRTCVWLDHRTVKQNPLQTPQQTQRTAN